MSYTFISLDDIKVYLNANSWIGKRFEPLNMVAYMPPERFDSNQFLSIPIKYDKQLETLEVNKVIDSICKILRCSEEALLDEIEKLSKLPIDILSFRMISKFTEGGSLPLSLANTTITSLKQAVMNSIRFELIRNNLKQTSSVTNHYLDNFTFGQTKKGSFIFNIETKELETPSNSEQTDSLSITDNLIEPLERKVIERIQYTLGQIQIASMHKNIDKGVEYVRRPDIAPYINASLIRDIKDILEEHTNLAKRANIHTGLKLESSMHLSPIYKGKSKDFATNPKVLINNNSFELIKILSQSLITLDEVEREKVILNGKIKGLKLYEPNSKYIASIDVAIQNHKLFNSVKINLDRSYYFLAIKALEKESTIQIKGITKKHKPNSKWELDKVESIEILPNVCQLTF